jgi:hypothetical protein
MAADCHDGETRRNDNAGLEQKLAGEEAAKEGRVHPDFSAISVLRP